jgi:hypothetical protein
MNLSEPEDRILNEFTENIKSIFPDIHINNGGYGYDFHVGNLGENYSLRDSQYYLHPKGREFFHLTSYRNLFSIVNSGFIRMYNLKNSDDANELSFFSDTAFPLSVIDHFKNRTFIFSGCHIDNLGNKDLWKGYGNVAIVYEFTDEASQWSNFHLAKIKYEKNPAFEQLGNLFASNNKKYPGLLFRYDPLPSLIAFHKTPDFMWEKEVRLMYVPPFSPRIEQFSDFKVSKHHTGYTEYIELPTFIDQPKVFAPHLEKKRVKHFIPDGLYEHAPQIKIKRIVFGDNEKYIGQRKFQELRNGFRMKLREKLGYQVSIDEELFVTGVKD